MEIKYIKVAVQKDKYDKVSKAIEEIALVVAVDETVDDMIAEELAEKEKLAKDLHDTVEMVQQLWQCIINKYTYNESKIHIQAYKDGKTTAKRLVVIDKEDV
tara:strand:+ start:592 stop:897 length:306 start_codon:yes stop_codon:yes gene_type:complete